LAGSDGHLPPAYFLGVSGGGGDGAFGAGVLCGWFDAGTMPTCAFQTIVITDSSRS